MICTCELCLFASYCYCTTALVYACVCMYTIYRYASTWMGVDVVCVFMSMHVVVHTYEHTHPCMMEVYVYPYVDIFIPPHMHIWIVMNV